jgi:hypothetical protein
MVTSIETIPTIGAKFALDHHATLVAQGTVNAIGVTCCKNANYRRALGDEFAA